MMNSVEQHFNSLYEHYLTNIELQGKRPATIDAYSRVVRQLLTIRALYHHYIKRALHRY